MQTKNLGFTCGRLDPEIYSALVKTGQKRGIKTNKVIELAVKVTTLIASRRDYLTPEGKTAIEAILGP